MLTLRDVDARAVDLLLDRAAMAQGNGGVQFADGSGVSGEQIVAVERVLNLLGAMPPAEPGSDLVRRTLDRIVGADPATLPMERPAPIDIGLPMA